MPRGLVVDVLNRLVICVLKKKKKKKRRAQGKRNIRKTSSRTCQNYTVLSWYGNKKKTPSPAGMKAKQKDKEPYPSYQTH